MLSIHAINTLNQHTPSRYQTDRLYRHTLSTHLINTGTLRHTSMQIDGAEGGAGLTDDQKNDSLFRNPKIRIPAYEVGIWDADPDLVDTRHLITESFRIQWDKGIQAYITGDWIQARDIFHNTVKLPNGEEDGPSKFLIHIIDESGGTAPSNWPEYRMDDGGH